MAGGPCTCCDVQTLRRLFREFSQELATDLRQMMREELRNALGGRTYSTPRVPFNQDQASSASHFQLHFSSELPDIIFTSNVIESKDGKPLQVFITDDNNRMISSGPLSTARIEIVVLDDDFDDDECITWTVEEFKKHVLRERKGKLPLLGGNCFVTLKDGCSTLGDISFTDNSKWTKTHKFRLAARVLCNGLVEERIQAAISGAFAVNDHRGEYTMKHHIPSLNDEVWRLKSIGKDGPYHQRLEKHGIKTVQDFLRCLVIDQEKLCTILFCKRMTKKKWNTILQHAWKCDLGYKRYSYTIPGHQVELVFNSVFQLIAARFGEKCLPLAQLPASQKNLIDRMKGIAYSNQNDMVEIDDASLSSLLHTAHAPETSLSNVPQAGSHHSDKTSETGTRNCLDPSIAAFGDDSNHVEIRRQPCFFMEGCRMDGVTDQEASSAMQICDADGFSQQSTEVHVSSSCSSMFLGEKSSATHGRRSKWVKLRFNPKLRVLIKKSISDRRNARTRHIKSFRRVMCAFRFGNSIRALANNRRMASMLRSPSFWYYDFNPQLFDDDAPCYSLDGIIHP